MSHCDFDDANFSGGFQQPLNRNWHTPNTPDSLSQQQHSFHCIPSQNQTNLPLPPPPPPLPPLLPPSLPPHLNSSCHGNDFRKVGNEIYQTNTNNTQSHSFQGESPRPAQPFHYDIGSQASQPFQNWDNRPPQPFSYNHDNQPPQPFPYNYSNQPPPHPFPYNHGNQSSRFEMSCSTSPSERFQPQFSASFQRPRSPFLHPTVQSFFRTPPPKGVQFHQKINIDTLSSREDESLNSSNLMEKHEEIKGLNSWMKNVQARIVKEENGTSELKIYDVQKKLLRYATLMSELDSILKQLSLTAKQLDQEDWESTTQKSEDLKKELEELRSFFGDKQTVNKIQEILSNRREKRLKWRRGKAKRAKERQRIKEERKNKEVRIDKMLKKLNDEEKEKRQEENMKREADSVLREVRTKQEDVVKMQKLLEALSKLREVRRKKGEMHGYVEDPRANVFFDKMKTEFDGLLIDQQNLYRAEEQTLKIMMEESRAIFPHTKKLPQQLPLNLSQLKKAIFEIYFGRNESKDKEYERSFLAAEESVEILVKRRKDWDQFIVPEDNPLGSSVPVGWVVPNIEPTEDWKSFQRSS